MGTQIFKFVLIIPKPIPNSLPAAFRLMWCRRSVQRPIDRAGVKMLKNINFPANYREYNVLSKAGLYIVI